MAKSGKKSKCAYALFRFSVVFIFVGGFIYQTLQFLFLYWTYPTVVDIQQSSPSYLEVPAFSFCNRIGYFYENICSHFEVNPCANSFLAKFAAGIICDEFPYICVNNTLPTGFKTILYSKFMEKNIIKVEDFPYLSIPLKDYLTCTIEFAGKVEECNMDSVLGSFYSVDELPQFCYTIYSLWGTPDKKREKIPKGAIMKFHLYLNITQRLDKVDEYGLIRPKYNPPIDQNVQIAVHSPYFLPSPFMEGSSFKGGRAYEMRIKLRESHLLPLPYQTNCTDYMTLWRKRGGKAPINQPSMIQECRINKTYEALGCIPMLLDYPHPYNICSVCLTGRECKYVEPPNDCTMLADNYNQPCDSIVYEVEKEDKVITLFRKIDSVWAHESDGLRLTLAEYDCTGYNFFTDECSTIDIDVPFDRYEITNITYNPKFESLELFSVIGGYMGMWLGISLLTMFDLLGDAIVMIRSFITARNKKKSRIMKMKTSERRKNIDGRVKFQPTTYNVW